jgi:DNA mismatch repair ATPase MutS
VSCLSDRAKEALSSALALTNELLQDVIGAVAVQPHMEALFRLTDSVALLDMLAAFADLVALSPQKYTRPVLVDDPSAAVENGHLPIAGRAAESSRSGTSANASARGATSHPLVIKAGRHPIISSLRQEGGATGSHGNSGSGGGGSGFVPNDCFLGPLDNVQVITGPNGSGKVSDSDSDSDSDNDSAHKCLTSDTCYTMLRLHCKLRTA